MFRNGKPSVPRGSLNKVSELFSSGSREKQDPSNMDICGGKSKENVGEDEYLNFHYIGEEENEERESRSFMLEEEDDMEVMSVNDQQQYLKELSSSRELSSTKSSTRSVKSVKENKYEMGLSHDSIPLNMKKRQSNQKERDLRDSVSSIVSSENEYREFDDLNSSQESHNFSSRAKPRKKQPTEPPVTTYRPAKMAEYIKRFRTAPPTKRGDRKPLEFDNDRQQMEQVTFNPKKSNIEPQERRPVQKTNDNFPHIDVMDFDINQLNAITHAALENENYQDLDLDQIMTRLSNEKSNLMSGSSEDDNLDEIFRQSVLSRLQSIGLHESYIDPDNFEILGSNRIAEECDAVSRVEELLKERNQVEQMLNRDFSIKNQQHSWNSTIPKEISMPIVSKSQESLDSNNSVSFEQRQLNFMDEEELYSRLDQQPLNTQAVDNSLGKSIASVSSISSIGQDCYIQQSVNQLDRPDQQFSEVDFNDDENELFTTDFICQSLRLKIGQLKQGLTELERKYSLLE